MNRDELLNRLINIDYEASLVLADKTEKVKIVIVGGGALLLKNIISRATPDIDTLNFYEALSDIMEKYDMNFGEIKAFYTRYYSEYLGYNSKSDKILSKIF